jgi:putative aminopeptidase FrvX
MTWRRELLQELIGTYGPCGQEQTVRDICRRELSQAIDDVHVDEAGNLIGLLRGRSGEGAKPIIRVMAHLDELSMIVKRIDDDGSLHVQPLGVMYPGNFGLGPVAVLGDNATITGVLSLGSEHTTKESMRIWQTKPDQGDKALDWLHVFVFTGKTRGDLAAAGVHIGTSVCVHRSKRSIVDVGDHLGSYFLDNRAALVIALSAARELATGAGPANDVYFVLTTSEEMGGIGASYAGRVLPGEVTLALDVGPAEAEYQTTAAPGPLVGYADDVVVYDRDVADRLMQLGAELGVDPRPAVFGSYESDASNAKIKGQSAQAGLLAIATLNTHGYEVIHNGAIESCARLLTEYLRQPVSGE